MIKRTFILTFFLLLFNHFLVAQKTTLTGVVTDDNGAPIAYATVGVKGSSTGTSANANGEYSLAVSSNQSVVIQARCTGYISNEHDVTVNGQTQTVNIQLKTSEFNLDEVVVTGTRTEKTLKDVPVITRVITSNDIKKLDTPVLIDLLESELPGLEFTSHGGNPIINLQGLGGNYILFLVNGERITGETNNNIDYNRLNVDNIERIEIVKGSASTLYGSNAMGGVINIITKEARKPFQANINGRYGSHDEYKIGASVGGRIKNFSTLTSASYRHINSYDLHDTEYAKQEYEDGMVIIEPVLRTTTVEGGKNRLIDQKFTYTPSEKWKIDLSGGYYDRERFNAGDAGAKRHDFYRDYNAMTHITHTFNPTNSLTLSYNFDNYNKYDYYLLLDLKELNYKSQVHNPRLMYNLLLAKKHTLTSGVEFLSESLKTYMFDNGTTERAESYVAFVQDDYQISKSVSLIAGLRYDYHSAFGGHLSPKLWGMLRKGIFTFRGGYSGGFRSPTLKELYTDWDHQGMFQIVGNKDLDPETSHNLSFSGEITKGKINANVIGYYNEIKDKITGYWNTAQDTSFYTNADKANVWGIDANFNWNATKNIAFKLSYSYVNDKVELEGRNISSTRPHSATLRADYSFKLWKTRNSLILSGRTLSGVKMYSYDDDRAMYYKTKYPGYSTWKLSLSSQLPRGFTLTAGINNLLDYTAKVSTFNSSLSSGRTFYIGLSCNIEDIF